MIGVKYARKKRRKHNWVTVTKIFSVSIVECIFSDLNLNSNSNSKCYSLNCLSCMFAVDEKLNASCNLTKFRFP